MPIIKIEDTNPAHRYDHATLAKCALESPGSWFTDLDYPPISSYRVMRGIYAAYRPAAAFRVRSFGGQIAVSFIGVPVVPFDPETPGVPSDDLERTLDDRRCPEGTPPHVLTVLRKFRQKGADAKGDDEKPAKKGKKKKEKKSTASGAR